MVEFNDSLTEIDWLNSLCIKKEGNVKDEKVFSIKPKESKILPKDFFLTDDYKIPNCNGFEKPSYSYAFLIKLAIDSSKDKRMRLNEIYSWITTNFPYYKHLHSDNNKGWKNAIRHNLSLNKIFKRCPKDSSHFGKGSYWTIDPDCKDSSIQCPPVKKLRICDPQIIQTIRTEHDEVRLDIKTTLSVTNIISPCLVSSSPEAAFPFLCTIIPSDSRCSSSLSSPVSCLTPVNTSCLENVTQGITLSKCSSTINTLQKSDTTSMFSNISAFSPYSIDNSNLYKEADSKFPADCSAFEPYVTASQYRQTIANYEEVPNSTCEISYSQPKLLYSNSQMNNVKTKEDIIISNTRTSSKVVHSKSIEHSSKKLEIDESAIHSRSAECNFILKTPILSQVTSISDDALASVPDSKDANDDTNIQKISISNNSFANVSESNELFDNSIFGDPFLQHSIYDSDSIYEKPTSVYQNSFILEKIPESNSNSSQSPVNDALSKTVSTINSHVKNTYTDEVSFDASFGLSLTSKSFLLNLPGVNENIIYQSEWSNIDENMNMKDETLSSSSANDSLDISFPSDISCKNEEYSTNDFLDMKKALKSYRFKTLSSSDVTGSTELNMADGEHTPSTEKSVGTIQELLVTSDEDNSKNKLSSDSSTRNTFDLLALGDNKEIVKTFGKDDDIMHDFNWDSIV